MKKTPFLLVPNDSPLLARPLSDEDMWQIAYDDTKKTLDDAVTMTYENNVVDFKLYLTYGQFINQLLTFHSLDDDPSHAKVCMEYLEKYYQNISP